MFRPCFLWLLACVGGASGCQSLRPSYSFAPVLWAGAAAPVAAPAAATAVPEPAPLLAPLPAPAASAAASAAASGPVLRPASTAPATAVAAGPRVLPLRSGLGSWRARAVALAPPAAAARLRPARPQAPAEVGLGTTVLGVLGLVALPIALLGLLISGGGLVWGVVAGLAALAILVAKLDPFG